MCAIDVPLVLLICLCVIDVPLVLLICLCVIDVPLVLLVVVYMKLASLSSTGTPYQPRTLKDYICRMSV